MKYLNTSGSHLRISEDRVVAPNAEVYLSDEEEKSLEVLKAKDFSWLTPVIENIVGDFIQGEINKIEGNKPSPVNNPFPLIVPGVTGVSKDGKISKANDKNKTTESLTKEQQMFNDMKQKSIDDAVKKAALNNKTNVNPNSNVRKSWNPMDSAVKGGDDDYVVPSSDNAINMSDGYSNRELQYDELPVTTTGGGKESVSRINYMNHNFPENNNFDVEEISDMNDKEPLSKIKDINNPNKKGK